MQAKKKIGLVQINESLSWSRQHFSRGKKMIKGSWVAVPTDQVEEEEQHDYSVFPYSVGMLQAYAEANLSKPEAWEFLLPIFRKVKVSEAVDHLREADIVGFSAYVWNINLSLAIAKGVKEQNPEVTIIFGGPQVPDHAEAFLRANPFIDVVCHGEGEVVFTEFLEHYEDDSWRETGSLSYLDDADAFHNNPRRDRVKDLEILPSPYLSGTFDKLAASQPEGTWIMLWETNRGCPFGCTFCDWGSAVGARVYKFDMDRLYGELEWFSKIKGSMIFCCDANFGMLGRDYDLASYAVALKELQGFPRSLSVQNTKNSTDKAYKVQKMLATSRMNPTVTLSFQSLDDATLVNIKRKNIKLSSFNQLQKKYTRDRIDTYSDIILSLPGETFDSFVEGVSVLIDGGQHNRILFYNLSILPNAEMGNPDYQKEHGIKYVPQEIISIHSSVEDKSEIPEYLDTVIETNTMPAEDWMRAKTFWWMCDLFYFSKMLQIPFVIIQEEYDISYGELLKAFLNPGDRPILNKILQLFQEKAKHIQGGGDEYIAESRWLSINWPADQYAQLLLAENQEVEALYAETRSLIKELLSAKGIDFDNRLIDESWELNQNLLKLPFLEDYCILNLHYNLSEFYKNVLRGEKVPLREGEFTHYVDRSVCFPTLTAYCDQLVWAQNQKRHLLYPQKVVETNTEEAVA